MSVELGIFKVFCSNRDLHALHHRHVNDLKNLERELKLLFNLLGMYYEEFSEYTFVEPKMLKDYFELQYPKSKDKDSIDMLIETAYGLNVNEDMIQKFLDQMNEKHVATALVNKLMPVIEGEKYGILADLRDDIDSYVDNLHNPPDRLVVPIPCDLDIGQLIEKEVLEPGLPWRLGSVTNVVGGIRPSTLGLIFAFVDSGKTSFALDNVMSWADHLEENECICYCGNEEEAGRLKLRGSQAYLKQRLDWLGNHREEAEALLTNTGFKKVHFFDDIVEGDQIKYILKEYKPRVMVIDQATDVEVQTKRKTGNQVEYMKALFKWYRRAGNEHNLGMVAVAQGVGDAENTKWLKLSDIYGSRVAIQGALDYAIGVGRKVDDLAVEHLRFLNFPKNKLNGGEGGRITTHFTKQSCLWKEV